ncbi:MAG: hypothetical protein CMP10_03470 [Zetaproteobacteria bacterium]|nr:hypothetical protein [Pseudobdellovibrionaceae bacterium]
MNEILEICAKKMQYHNGCVKNLLRLKKFKQYLVLLKKSPKTFEKLVFCLFIGKMDCAYI